jgi:N-acetylmuramoyl-L-alanine amidase
MLSRSKLSSVWRRVGYALVLLVMAGNAVSATVSAVSCSSSDVQACPYTPGDLQSFENNTSFYDNTEIGGSCNATASGGTPTNAAEVSAAAKINFQTIFNALVKEGGYTKEQAAGIIGNLVNEDGTGDPQRAESGEKSLATPPDPDNANVGYGIAQWTPARKLINYAASINQPVNTLSTQISFLIAQLNGSWTANSEKGAGDDLKGTTTVETATAAFLGTKNQNYPSGAPYAGQYGGYERPRYEDTQLAPRTASAKIALATYGPQTGPTVPVNIIASTPAADPATATAGASTTSSGSVGGCTCAANAIPTASADGKKTIVLDPGHSPSSAPHTIDPATNIVVGDYENDPEMQQMYDASLAIAAKLTAAGYTVINTKKSVNDVVSLKERADIAGRAQSALGLSLHSTPGSAASGNSVFYPKVGEWRITSDANTALAAADKAAAETMASVRSTTEGQPVKSGSYADLNNGQPRTVKAAPPFMEQGTLLTTQYFATTPWVYNEQATLDSSNNNNNHSPVPDDILAKYVDGIVAGVEKIVPLAGGATATPAAAAATTSAQGNSSCAGSSAVLGNAVQTAINYAWPDYHQAPYLAFKPSYRAAIDKAIANHEYVGGGANPGVDCGGFVTRVMRDSGADPNYNDANSNTDAQKAYMDRHPEKYQNLGTQAGTTNLQPGDIAINDEHTYIYVGNQPGFNGNSASSSFSTTGRSWRTPMASPAYGFSGDSTNPFTWYRLKA